MKHSFFAIVLAVLMVAGCNVPQPVEAGESRYEMSDSTFLDASVTNAHGWQAVCFDTEKVPFDYFLEYGTPYVTKAQFIAKNRLLWVMAERGELYKGAKYVIYIPKVSGRTITCA